MVHTVFLRRDAWKLERLSCRSRYLWSDESCVACLCLFNEREADAFLVSLGKYLVGEKKQILLYFISQFFLLIADKSREEGM